MSTGVQVERTTTFGTEGLHARPAADIVKISKRFQSKIELLKGGRVAAARSSVKLLLLGVMPGEQVTVRADGPDADVAVQELLEYIATKTSNGPPPDATAAAPRKPWRVASSPKAPAPSIPPAPGAAPALRDERRFTGVCGSPGAAIGPAFILCDPPVRVPTEPIEMGAVDVECARLDGALQTLARELQDMATTGETGAIVLALLEIATDAELRIAMVDRVRAGHHPIRAALDAGEAIAAEFASIQDPMLRARADDIRSVARRVVGILCGHPRVDPSRLQSPSIVVAPHLDPWDLARLPTQNILGILTAEGGATSHISIIARSLGIPALVGVALDVISFSSASTIALDAEGGVALVDPTPEESTKVRLRIEAANQERQELEVYRNVRPCTRGGRAIAVAANVGSLAEVARAQAAGAMGVGLFRTELLFMERGGLPDEAKQAAIYAGVARAFPQDRVVIRTLDIGGDKVVPGIVDATESNPFLGWRGIRMCLDRPDLFKPQLRALLRAAVHGNLDVMFPMISDGLEVTRAKAMLAACEQELSKEGVPFGRPRIGIMIETPAAALCAAELAKVAEFFSIGTNNLTQYVMAADRTNPRLAHLSSPGHPAVLAMMEMTCRAARSAGIPVAVCGEAASNPDLIPTLVRFGVDELSMNSPAIPRAKRIVTQCA